MRISELIEGLPIFCASGAGREVSGISHDSRRVAPGDLFAALIGQRHDGRIFVPEALERGAAAVLARGAAPPGLGVPWLACDDPRQVLGPLAARIFDHPDRELLLLGVTGTNGKSTVVALLEAVLETAGTPCGRLGTLGYTFRRRSFGGERTTPEASDLCRTLREMRQAGAEAVAMEVSSHALALGRVAGLGFSLAVFTNLSRDHFDFHRDFEDYFAAKRRLFDALAPGGRAVVNIDDAYGRRLAADLESPLTFGREGEVAARRVEIDAEGIRGLVSTPRGEFEFRSRLLGAYNLENLLAAAAAAEALGIEHAAIAAAFAALPPLPGRMQRVDRGQGFPVMIDYAHTDAGLEAALRSLKGLTRRKVILVFGCGGDRDAGKRTLMGRVAGELAELPIVTSDNPRREDPLAIIAAVEQGLKQSGSESYRIVPDRREAIRRAIAVAAADPDWCVLIAGKGHEAVQIIGQEVLPFSDYDEAVRALEEYVGSGTPG